MISNWSEKQCPAVFPDTLFPLVVSCFLSKKKQTQLAKDAHEILNLDQLRRVIGPWPLFNTYGEALFKELRAAYYAVEMPARMRNQPRISSQYSQTDDIWSTPTTLLSTSQSTLPQLILTDTETAPSDLIPILLSTQQSPSKHRPLSIVSENVGRKRTK
jgi:hypothetical protein